METRGPRSPSSIPRTEPRPSIVRLTVSMRHNDASACAASRRCSPSAWRSAFSAALALVLLVSCGSTVGSGGTVGSGRPDGGSSGGAVNVPFSEVTSLGYGRHDSGPAIIVGTNDHWRATLARLVDGASVPA